MIRSVVPFTSHAGRVSTPVPTALLFLLFSVPLMLFCRDHNPLNPNARAVPWSAGIWRSRPDTLARRTPISWCVVPFILASFLYQDAIGTIVSFMAVYAVKAMHFERGTEATLFLVLTIPAIFGSYIAGRIRRSRRCTVIHWC